MNRFFKYFYVFITTLFALLTAYEIYMYMKIDSNYFGIFYLFLNFFVMFLLFTITYNYESASKNIRISKNIVSIIVGVLSSFVLAYLLPYIFDYVDDSFFFNDSIYVISKIIKPIMYLSLGIISFLEIKQTK